MRTVVRLLPLVLLCFYLPAMAEPRAITVAYANHWSPYSYESKDKHPKGILVDIAEYLLAKELGFDVRHVALPWKRAQAMVRSGRYDALITAPTMDRLNYTISSEHTLYRLKWQAYLSRFSPRYGELSAMDNPLKAEELRCVLLLGDMTSSRIYDKFRQHCQTVKNLDNAVRMLQAGRVDVFVHARAIMSQQLQKHDLANAIVRHESVLKEVSFNLLVSRLSPHVKTLPAQLDQYLGSSEGLAQYQDFLNLIDNRAYLARQGL